MQTYVYQPLRQAPNSIRLLQILPGDEGTDIHCQILDYTIRPDGRSALYEALSYVWGEPGDKRRIYVDHVCASNSSTGDTSFLEVTKNLYAALQRLRDPELPRLLWADAVCIDQRNLPERGNQVRFMSRIYSCASRVIVWLGEEGDDSAFLFASMEEMAIVLLRCRNHEAPPIAPRGTPNSLRLSQSLSALLERAWFDRVWVLQEATAARHLSLICGTAEITGSSFSLALPHFLFDVRDTRLRRLGASIIEMIRWNAPSRISDPSSSLDFLPLGELLELFHTRKATDQRDKVFALLGISQTASLRGPPPQPDYTLNWSTVFQQLINHLLGPSVVVTTWDSEICAVIAGRGRPFGQVSQLRDACVRVENRSLPGPPNAECSCEVTWKKSTYCKDIELGDILWQTEGALLFSIIRFCKDHFDIVMVNVEMKRLTYNPNKNHPGGALTPNEDQVQACELIGWRQVLLIWDWLPMAEQNQKRHCAFLQGVRGGLATLNSRLSRLSASAKILDDLRDHERLSSLVPAMLECQDCTASLTYIRLLNLVCSHWQSYMWLKTYVEEMRWCLWKLETVPDQQADLYASVARFWSEGNCLPWDIIDIASLDPTPPSTVSQAISTVGPAQWAQLDPLSLLMFPGCARAPKPPGFGGRHQLERYLIRLILAQKDLKPNGSRTLPYEALSAHRSIFGGVGGQAPRYTIPTSLSTQAIISEHTNRNLHLSPMSIGIIAKHPDALHYLTFLLSECYKNIGTVYDILATIVRHVPNARNAIWMFDGNIDHPIAPWCYFNLEILDYYIRHTDLVTRADCHENDTVIPALVDTFARHGRTREVWGQVSQPCSSRDTILRGIEGFRSRMS